MADGGPAARGGGSEPRIWPGRRSGTRGGCGSRGCAVGRRCGAGHTGWGEMWGSGPCATPGPRAVPSPPVRARPSVPGEGTGKRSPRHTSHPGAGEMVPSTPGPRRLGGSVAEEAAGGCAALMPQRCGNFLRRGGAESHRFPGMDARQRGNQPRPPSSALGPWAQPSPGRHLGGLSVAGPPPAHPWLRSFSVLSSQRRTATALPSRHCVKMSSMAGGAVGRDG